MQIVDQKSGIANFWAILFGNVVTKNANLGTSSDTRWPIKLNPNTSNIAI